MAHLISLSACASPRPPRIPPTCEAAAPLPRQRLGDGAHFGLNGVARNPILVVAVLSADTDFLMPQLYHRLTIRSPRGACGRTVRRVRVARQPSSYASQLSAFGAAVLDGGPILTSARDAVVTMGIIDDIYRAAGLPPRGESGL